MQSVLLMRGEKMNENGAEAYRRFLHGDRNALEELVRIYSDDLVRYVFLYVRNTALAEDIMEDTFASLIIKKKKLETPCLRAYLYRIARNKCIDYFRSRRSKEVPLEEYENILNGDEPDNEVIKRERNQKIYTCLQQLPPQYRDVLYFSYFDGCSAEEIQKIMGKSKKQIYNLLARAKSSLKEIFIREGIGHEELL